MIVLPTPRIYTITEISRAIKSVMETEFPFISVTGEISNLRQPFSGHLYFTLKDENAQLKAVLFKTQQRYLPSKPVDGDMVICRGRISVYEPRGEYQLIVDHLEFQGAGTLWLAFQRLKNELAREGLFDPAGKRPLPLLPEKIALVTSPDGAALFDFLKIAANRCPAVRIEIVPVRVQGEGAAREICEAIKYLNQKHEADVIVLCRGGGSLEDLWPFNEEVLARAIHASELPVVSAVGHEVDFTIADFVADLRAATPSGAAELLVPDRRVFLERLGTLLLRLRRCLEKKINDGRQRVHLGKRMLGDPRSLHTHMLLRLDHALEGLVRARTAFFDERQAAVAALRERIIRASPAGRLLQQRRWNDELLRRLQRMMHLYLEHKQEELRRLTALLTAVGPLAVLERGYAVVRTVPAGRVVRSSREVDRGEVVEVLLHEGGLACEIVEKK